MRCVIVCESLFGNTAAIARAIADGVQPHADVRVATPLDADRDGVDLLIVGTPTQAWGLPRPRTWVRGKVPAEHTGPFVRDWLATLPLGDGRSAAAFTTRLNRSRWLTGSATGGIARRLRQRGWTLIARPREFIVEGIEGPLAQGELAAAERWGARLAAQLDELHAHAA